MSVGTVVFKEVFHPKVPFDDNTLSAEEKLQLAAQRAVMKDLPIFTQSLNLEQRTRDILMHSPTVGRPSPCEASVKDSPNVSPIKNPIFVCSVEKEQSSVPEVESEEIDTLLAHGNTLIDSAKEQQSEYRSTMDEVD